MVRDVELKIDNPESSSNTHAWERRTVQMTLDCQCQRSWAVFAANVTAAVVLLALTIRRRQAVFVRNPIRIK